ncbi:alpha/beta hydrolase-fold protein [Paraliomyxa miuraensis]|uniref:alpha/beta hydrolase-fold protein n=1 Tax=Paraliomyxa miuraensis TaxID=376150 RepID=UPI00225BA509|nr:alpha/beta hydrolase-fold protein [Paraliomyxa miuraensis]MCX4240880.1 alpha/beta hydrolase-fold protein [Paraliomyxa miuraensis]
MRHRHGSSVWPSLGLVALLGLGASACGDDTGSTGGDESSTTDAPGTTTLPLPTGSTQATDTLDPSTDTVDPDTTAEDTGPPSDLPPPEEDDCDRLDALVAALPDADPGDRPVLVDEFVRAVSYGDHGFPILCDDRLAVAHLGEPGESLSLVGDFNGWTPDEHVLTEPVAGLGFYVGLVEPAGSPEGLYKLVRDGVDYFADPLARRFGWDGFGEYSQIDPMPDRGHHERWPDFSEGIGPLQPRTVTVYLPVEAQTQTDLPVLYMHDGQNLFSPEAFFGGWRVSETLEVAIGDGTLPPLVVVGIDNTSARFEEYTQVTDVIGGMRVGGQADDYASFVVDGVKPFVEQRHPVSSDPQDVGVMGSSLGGLVSLYIGLRYPEVFGQVASMSGTIDWGTIGASNPTILDLYAGSPPLGLRIYLDSGGSEGLGCPGDGSDNYCGNVAMAELLRGSGWADEVDLFYRWDPGAPHNEAAWADRLLPALVDWFPAGG